MLTIEPIKLTTLLSSQSSFVVMCVFLESILDYKPCHILLKGMGLFKRSDHMNPHGLMVCDVCVNSSIVGEGALANKSPL